MAKRASALSSPLREERRPTLPREAWPPPKANLGGSWGCRPVVMKLGELLRNDQVYHLPPYQREQVWSSEQQVTLCKTLWVGLPVAPLLLWAWGNRDAQGRQHYIVLDGQQRLCALGAQIYRHDGAPCTPTRAVLDLETGRWHIGEPDGVQHVTMAQASDAFETATPRLRSGVSSASEGWRLIELLGDADNRLSEYAQVVVYAIGSATDKATAATIFRTWNIPGTPISPAEIDALIQKADLSWEPIR